MHYTDRIHPGIDLELSTQDISQRLELGEYTGMHIIKFGFEDLVVRVGETAIKYFSKEREDHDLERLDLILTEITSPKIAVNHPRLYPAQGAYNFIHTIGGSRQAFMVMEWIDGGDYTSGRPPNEAETRDLVGQLARMHSSGVNVPPVENEWVLASLVDAYQKTETALEISDRELLEPAVADFDAIQHRALPDAFVHGDLFKGNVLRGSHLIDFSKAGVRPRIYELAVAAHLFFDPNNPHDFSGHDRFVATYDSVVGLEDTEREFLPVYVRAAHACAYLCAVRNEQNGVSTPENDSHKAFGLVGL